MCRTSSRVVELEKKINKLSEERVELYKTQSENAQRLFRLSEQLRGREENEKRLSEETIQLSEQVKRLSAKCEEQVYLLREKDKGIQVLQDEFSALHLEITTIEEKNKKLVAENNELLKRWMDMKNKEAEKMNEATQFYEQ